MPDDVALDRIRDRDRMVERQIASRGVHDRRVLEAMRTVPREIFVPEEVREFSYEDTPLPIGEGQTISQPYIIALMLEAAEIGAEDHVLEVGAGSGYAAAVLGRLAADVWTMERIPSLAAGAREALQRAGARNVQVVEGDGTLGLPEHAPFQAILVAAGGPKVPEPLVQQLAPGGRLVMPVGDRQQNLISVRRVENGVEVEELEQVSFVPLVGREGWPETPGQDSVGEASTRPAPVTREQREANLVSLIRQGAEPLPEIEDPEFGALIDRAADKARVVLLGEASHGTSEFYRARAQITRRLIERHGFTIVAAEADWPDAASIDRYVRHFAPSRTAERAFARFPTWMWRNAEVRDLVEWLRGHNVELVPARRAGFYGLDLYSLHTSAGAVLEYLDRTDPDAAQVARERYGCLTPWQRDPATYGRAALRAGYALCEDAVTATLRDLLAHRLEYMAEDPEAFLDAEQNARLVASAEQYYRVMYYGSAESWNLRDSHMLQTLRSVLDARGPDSKAVVWAHNSHVGDASATDMSTMRGELNLGQLCREQWGDRTFIIGFGTDRGTVAAASDWDGPMEIKSVRPSRPDSYEHLCHRAGIDRFLLDLRAERTTDLQRALAASRLERAIGVIYRPETELASHYFEASLSRQFDAYIWFDETRAVTPLEGAERPSEDMPETYPFGM